MRPSTGTGSSTVNAILSSGVNFVQFTSGQNIIQLASGTNFVTISGTAFSASGNVISTSVSGNVVSTTVSGNWLNITSASIAGFSGLNVISTATANISGQAVFLGSGSAIGLSGVFVTATVQGDTSGSVVYLTSGKNFVFISGSPIVNISGFPVTVSGQTICVSGPVPVTTSISGNAVSISGAVTVLMSGGLVRTVSGNAVTVSGNAMTVSGNSVTVSGNAVTMSGNVVSISGTVTVSVNNTPAVTTSISGQSVQPTYTNNTAVRARNILAVTAASGGTLLNSGDCSQVTIRALSGNTGVIYVGGTGTERAWGNTSSSGNGFVLGPGDGMTFPISNMNLVSVSTFSGTGVTNSGDKIAYMGVEY